MYVHPDLIDLVTLLTLGLVNADGVLKLQHYQDTYIAHCTKLAVKRPSKLYID